MRYLITSTLMVSLWSVGANADSSFSVGLGFSYTKGRPSVPYYGIPMFGYGAAYNSYAALGTCAAGLYTGNSYFNGLNGNGYWANNGSNGAYFPGLAPSAPSLPPPPPMIPPHIAMGAAFGMNSFAGGSCIPCGAGYAAQPIYPVAGGPLIAGGSAYGAQSGFAGSAGGTTVVDLSGKNEWEKSDTADIVWATALGLGMQATNVTPIAVPRYGVTALPPTFFSTGGLTPGHIPRPHAP